MPKSIASELARVAPMLGVEPGNGLGDVERRLQQLYSRGALAKAHAILQYTIAAYLYTRGYDVQVEYDLPDGLRADVYAEAPWEELIVEVETGRVPPRFIVEYDSYMRARLAYKVLLYSQHAPTALAIPSYLEPFTPRQLLKYDGERGMIANLIQAYYNVDPARLQILLDNARLERVYVINLARDSIDIIVVEERSPDYHSILWM